MGVDRGFDLYPPLQNTDADNEKWARFLADVIAHYKKENDSNLTVDASGSVIFNQGEHPKLNSKGYQFRRFSSKITGSHAGDVRYYLSTVEAIAKLYFGDRVHHWDEGFDESEACYGWDEVYAADGRFAAANQE
ncbi:hypothetical protein B0H13DRAFT_1095649 [Mycena leptocephala]|nr:hypothetical protein B0H13DRAFT_1095649 [Mycena leptocephala]